MDSTYLPLAIHENPAPFQEAPGTINVSVHWDGMGLATPGPGLRGSERRAFEASLSLAHLVDDVAVARLLVPEASEGPVLGLGEGGVLGAPLFVLADDVQYAHVGFGVAVGEAVLHAVSRVDEAGMLKAPIRAARVTGDDNVVFRSVRRAPFGTGVSGRAVAGRDVAPRENACLHR